MRPIFFAAVALLGAGLFERIDTAMSMTGSAVAFALTAAGPALPMMMFTPG